ncbi:MAG: glutamine amidotransferase, partial [Candidatus Latescibacterota bacterium]
MLDPLLTWLTGNRLSYQSIWFTFDQMANPVAIALLLLTFSAGLFLWHKRSGWGVAAVRTSGLVLALFLILGPTLVMQRMSPGTHFVPILFDNSQSMLLDESSGITRGEQLKAVYAASSFEKALKQTHQVVPFQFGARPERLRTLEAMAFDQPESDIGGSVRDVIKQMQGVSVSAVVVFSDGAQQSTTPFLLDDLPKETPVFVVGVGQEDGWRDLALTSLSLMHTHFDRVAVVAQVRAENLVGEKVVVEVLDGTRKIATASFEVSEGVIDHQVRLEFSPQGEGWRSYQMRVKLSAHEDLDRIVENNVRDFVVDNRTQSFRILYFAGRPNWENKFVRRALDDVPQLALSSLIRISGAERKFVFRGRDATMANPLFEGFDDQALNAPRYDEAVYVRLGVGESELATGYPEDASELYRYHMVILGEVERNFFSQSHLELTRDFVSKRGGSLLLLGGPRSFAEGDWDQSVLEPVLPVVLGASGSYRKELIQAKPTIEGLLSGVWALDADPNANAMKWLELPALFGNNGFTQTRAGATVLARTDDEKDAPLFVWHRYGEGVSAVLATGETWAWQMMADQDDVSHERFWRQLARFLVTRVPQPVTLMSGGEDVVVGEERVLQFMVRDSLFVAREGLLVDVTLKTGPNTQIPLPVIESLEEPGVYTASFVAEVPGLHLLAVTG